MAVIKLIDAALRFQGEAGRFAYLAPLYKQAKAVAWDYLKHYARMIPETEINESELWVQFPNGARVRLFGADNPDSLRGLYLDGVVLDEVAQMKPEVWGEIVQPTLADRRGWALFIGTPKGINLFSDVYFSAQANDDWYAGLWGVYDTDALAPEEIEAQRQSMTEMQFAQEFLCDFGASSDNVLIPFTAATEACARVITPDQIAHAPRIVGVDVARQGGDRTVIFKRQGLQAFTPKVMIGADAMAVAAAVLQVIRDWEPDAVFIDGSGGYGAGVIDRLRQLNENPIEIQFGGKPLDGRMANKRTEMWWNMAEWVKGSGALPRGVPALLTDLCAPTYDYANSANKIALESKDKIRSRINVSPDMGDALALTFAYPVAPRGINGARASASQSMTQDYDPYARLG